METVQIYVCCHKRFPVPESPLLVPMQVGAALSGERWEGFARDDAGESISEKNRSYCELTALYWAWKHCEADWIGLFHYRRYLAPLPGEKRPYRIAARPSEALLEKLGFDKLPALIAPYDLVLPRPERMFVPARAHYAAAPHHRAEDLARMEEILRARSPEDARAAEAYLAGDAQLFGNLFVMRRALLQDYCAWLFPLLAEFDRRADLAGRSAQEARVDGYLAERLLGVYVTKRAGELKTLYLPRLHFDAIDARPDLKNRALYALLPPGTRRRAAVKRLINDTKRNRHD